MKKILTLNDIPKLQTEAEKYGNLARRLFENGEIQRARYNYSEARKKLGKIVLIQYRAATNEKAV